MSYPRSPDEGLQIGQIYPQIPLTYEFTKYVATGNQVVFQTQLRQFPKRQFSILSELFSDCLENVGNGGG